MLLAIGHCLQPVQPSAQNPRTSGLMTTEPKDFLSLGIKKCL